MLIPSPLFPHEVAMVRGGQIEPVIFLEVVLITNRNAIWNDPYTLSLVRLHQLACWTMALLTKTCAAIRLSHIADEPF